MIRIIQTITNDINGQGSLLEYDKSWKEFSTMISNALGWGALRDREIPGLKRIGLAPGVLLPYLQNYCVCTNDEHHIFIKAFRKEHGGATETFLFSLLEEQE